MSYVELLGPLAPQIQSDVQNAMWSSKVVVKCACGQTNEIEARSLVRKWGKKGRYLCKSCHVRTYVNDPERMRKQKESYQATLTPERREGLRKNMQKMWEKPGYRERISAATTQYNKEHPERQKAGAAALTAWNAEHSGHLDEIREKSSTAIKKKWMEDAEYREEVVERMRHALDKPESKEKHRAATAANTKRWWQDPKYREKEAAARSTPEWKEAASQRAKEIWENPEFRAQMEALWSTPEWKEAASQRAQEVLSRPGVREKLTAATLELWQREGFRSSISESIKAVWQDPIFREKALALAADPAHRALIKQKTREAMARPEVREKLAIARAKQGETSKCETAVCDLLKDLGVKFEQFKQIGFYTFDIAVPTAGKTILIEVQGDYWHNLPEVAYRDRQKATYIERYYSDQYVIKYVWEHELRLKDKVLDMLKYWFGITMLEMKDFNFDDVVLDRIESEEASRFLGRHHYLSGIGRHGYALGAKLNGELIAVSSLTPVTRTETATKQGLEQKDVRELTRFCIHPSYQKKNFASWFLSKVIRRFATDNPKITTLVAFADHSFNHFGTIYKAANWQFDGEVEPSYWYVDGEGYVMHKKTLYGKAKNSEMKEAEFAEKFGYQKVKGKVKSRYILHLRRTSDADDQPQPDSDH